MSLTSSGMTGNGKLKTGVETLEDSQEVYTSDKGRGGGA